MIRRPLPIVFAILLLLTMTIFGCVSVTGPNARVVDKEKALDSLIDLGMAYLNQGDRENSRRNFEKALEIDKNSSRAHNGLALLYQMNSEVALAEKSFMRALDEDKGYTSARVNYGLFLYEQKRFQEAYGSFVRASEDLSHSQRAQVLAYLGQAAKQIGNLDRAKAAFEHSLNIDGKLPLPLLELAEISFASKDYVSAKRYLDRYDIVAKSSPRKLLLGIQIERVFGNKNKEASYILALKNLYPYSKEYLEYKKLVDEQVSTDEK
ncbi:MAG: type IV pilus assembly protein PilF [Cellvibrionaceae bacterium]